MVNPTLFICSVTVMLVGTRVQSCTSRKQGRGREKSRVG